MVKFIASDLDGTLLDGEKRLPEEIFPLIRKLKSLGVLFAPASGRQYANLKKLFAPVENDVVFICENGALVKYRSKTLHLTPIRDRDARNAIHEIRALPHLYPMLCGKGQHLFLLPLLDPGKWGKIPFLHFFRRNRVKTHIVSHTLPP